MKFLKGLIFSLVFLSVSFSAKAVTTCLNISKQTRCVGNGATWNYKNEWSTGCGGVAIKGTSGCGSVVGTVSDTLNTSSSSDKNNNCWCKLTYPAVSQWVFASTVEDTDNCMKTCAYLCADKVIYSGLFKTLLNTNLSY